MLLSQLALITFGINAQGTRIDSNYINCNEFKFKRCYAVRQCLSDSDCTAPNVCMQQGNYLVCTPPTCSDGKQNQGETGIDCGGPNCPACPTCSDGLKNQDETDIDCGGVTCGRPCDVYQGCLSQNDCHGTASCFSGTCTPLDNGQIV